MGCSFGEPFDLDVHAIPEHGGVPEHLHYDIRYLVRARSEAPLVVSDESHKNEFGNIMLSECRDHAPFGFERNTNGNCFNRCYLHLIAFSSPELSVTFCGDGRR